MDESNLSNATSEYERQKQQRRAEKTSSGVSSRFRRRLLLWGGVLAALGVLGFGMVKLSEDVVVPSQDGTLSAPVSERDHIVGLDNAKITLVEYSDFQCPACAAFHPIVKKLLEEPELKDSIRFVYRSFPLTAIHKNAQLAAQAAEAAGMQGKFWEFHDRLFEQQQAWSGLSDAGARAKFLEYAADLGINIEEFKRSVDASETVARVREQTKSGESSGVNSTPTFYVNGKKMPQPNSYEVFKQFLIQARNAN